jgi:hypothetical protein
MISPRKKISEITEMLQVYACDTGDLWQCRILGKKTARMLCHILRKSLAGWILASPHRIFYMNQLASYLNVGTPFFDIRSNQQLS